MTRHPYASREYAAAFGDVAEPIELTEASLWILLRRIEGSSRRDAMGCYPVAPIDPDADWTTSFARLRDAGAVSFVLVSDVLTQPPVERLRAIFDHVAPFKPHHLLDLSDEPPSYSKHHRYEVRRARERCEIRTISLGDHLDAWHELYRELVARHEIRGIQAFSRQHFAALADLPAFTTVGAFVDDRLVSAHLWLENGPRVYSHVAASSEAGYALGAAYAIHDFAIHRFRESGARVVDLGGVAGADRTREGGGLDFFKRGFATRTDDCFVCGSVLDEAAYRELCAASGRATNFFPAYRSKDSA